MISYVSRRYIVPIKRSFAILASAMIFASALPVQAAEKPVKAVFHVNFDEAERQQHALKNASNVLKDAGPGTEIEVVCHGGGINLVTRGSPAVDQVAALAKQGVRFVACENTMREKKIAHDALLPGVTTVPSGASEVLKRQGDGYAYFKP